jgi:hypothetical protein
MSCEEGGAGANEVLEVEEMQVRAEIRANLLQINLGQYYWDF